MTSPLQGTTVVDATTSVAGQYCGRLLAMHGARVVLVEPPGGSPTRHAPPFVTTDAPASESLLFRHLNQGKQSLVVDECREEGLARLEGLAVRSDVLLRDQHAPLPDGGDELITCEVGDFPKTGPYAGWSGSELVFQALGGAMNATGDLSRQPLYGVGQRAQYAAGTVAYISVVAALWERRRTGAGQHVEATVYEAVASMGQNLVSQYSYNRTAESRAKYPGFLAMLECRDAWVVLFAIRNWPALCEVFDMADLADDPRFQTPGDRLERWPDIVARMQRTAGSRDADELVDALQTARISAERIQTLAELLRSEHAVETELLGTVVDPASGRSQQALRQLFRMSGVDVGIEAPSPRIGEHAGQDWPLVGRTPA